MNYLQVLTSPWRLLTPPPRRAPSNWERSCHAFGTNPINTRNTASAVVNRDASAPGRVDRRSTASAGSHRSLFTVDGLPEVTLPPDNPPILTLHLVDPPRSRSQHSHTVRGSNGDNGSSRSATPQQLQRDTTTLSTLRCPPQPAQGGALDPNQLKIPTEMHDPDPDGAAWPVQRGCANGYAGPEPRSGSLHGWGDEFAADTQLRNHQVSDRVPGQPLPALQPLPAPTFPLPFVLGAPERHPQQLPMHLPYSYGTQDPQQQQEQEQQQQPAPQGPPVPTLTSRSTDFLGPMHHLLQLPGAADTFVHKARQYRTSTEPPPPQDAAAASAASAEPLLVMMPQRSDGAKTAPAAAGAPAGDLDVVGPAPWPPGSAASPAQIGPDDVRNPMSFEYDPSLDHPRQHQHLQAKQQQDGSPLLYGEPPQPIHGSRPVGAPTGTAGGGSVRPDGRTLAGDRTVTVQAPGGDRGSDGAEVLTADGPFVVLEMKGPRGTPSTHAAAAAAFLSGASASPAAPDAAVAAAGMSLSLRGRMTSYFSKWRGVGDTLMPADHPVDILWSWLGSFLSILVVAVLNQYLTPHVSMPLMIASFGASAVLLFGVPASKLAQPRNFLGGQVVSAVVGVLVRLAFMRAPGLVWMSAALGMSLALAVMQITRTVHPPGGASALIASSALYIGPWYGFKFVLTVFFGCLAMLVVAMVVNNLSARRRYPTYWWGK
ncbi:hypothetical protein VOLCADRAFT_119578 [Volvox carteri f. nagariensis]|uniref:HPP transmembrane region domain-containing protein n=1 Tax=Volvox carteri f. nagariensis TaxID=3068 RepID=D8UEE6_VOLCA|nr:uncharacterized protein VOLCADRAFT_119578 [Volvox carteri f. nagariensis]EFJ41869.1 hypothetical protein VOLCADRAFT_119578 [Volvox carteri f. nagariensis]|eukprot:XP_002957067.1 hypothetical protein VOLCADRAFT_119578 [Volvox carteri f. nagariensis]